MAIGTTAALLMAGSAAISAGSTIYGASVAGSAAESAADAKAAAADRATQAQLEMFYKSNELLAPWRDFGADALTSLRSTLGLPAAGTSLTAGATSPESTGDPVQDFMNRTPGSWDEFSRMKQINPKWTVEDWAQQHYQNTAGQPGVYWGQTEVTDAEAAAAAEGQAIATGDPLFLPGTSVEDFEKSDYYNYLIQSREEGIKDIAGYASAGGSLDSGRTLSEASRFSGREAAGYFGEFQNLTAAKRNALFQAAGLGAGAAGTMSSAALTTGANVGQNYLTAGQAQAGGYINQANVATGAATSLANTATQGVNQYLFYNYLRDQNNPTLTA